MTFYMLHGTCHRVGHNGQGNISSQLFRAFMIVPTRHGYRLAFIRRKTTCTRDKGEAISGAQSPLLSAYPDWRSIYSFSHLGPRDTSSPTTWTRGPRFIGSQDPGEVPTNSWCDPRRFLLTVTRLCYMPSAACTSGTFQVCLQVPR